MDVTLCACIKSHNLGLGHIACFTAGECMCSPCECDCHYEE